MAQFTTAQETALTSAYLQADLNPSKRPDCIIAIAGWATLYSCVATYTVPATGDLSTAEGFATARMFAWSDFPNVSASKMKGSFPEEGGFDAGKCDVDLHDKYGTSTTTRDLTDLLSRAAFLENNRTGTETTLSAAITKTAATINVASTTGIVAGDVIHISQEAILVGTVASSTQFTGCTRGYLLTDATLHSNAVKVYGYMPSLIGRRLFVYKGYQDLALTDWLRMWGGTITEAGRSEPGKIKLGARGTTWEAWGGSASGSPAGKFSLSLKGGGKSAVPMGVRKIVRLGQINDDLNEEAVATFAGAATLGGDFRFSFVAPIKKPTGLGDAPAHFMLKSGDFWFGIISPLTEEIGSGNAGSSTVVGCDVVKGLVTGTYPDRVEENDPLDLAWSNATFTATAAPTGSDPIDLMLRLMTSTGGSTDEVTPGSNGAYDLYKKGIGLGINVEKIDLTTFTGIQDQLDYDDQSKVFFLFSESIPAKPFFDDELCKPFGWYLANGNDGRIKLIRPKNPKRVYFSRANNAFKLTHSSSTRTRIYYLPGGVYTPTALATQLTTGLSAVTGATITVTWSSSTGFFTIAAASGTVTFSAADSWSTIGHTTATAQTSLAGTTAVGLVTATDFNTVTSNDVLSFSISPVENSGARVGRVHFGCNYNWNEDRFDYQIFSDAEIENLSPFGEAYPYEIESKGLLRAFDSSGRGRAGWLVKLPPANSAQCEGIPAEPSSSVGIDASNSGAALLCQHLFNRYRNPPTRFKAKLKWKFNTREVGDNLIFTYAIDGPLADTELASTTFTSRIFEVVSIKPDPAKGSVEVELLGHRDGS